MIALSLAAATEADDGGLRYVPGSTTKVCQLTGDIDRADGATTLSETNRRYGVIATDLGSSFEHKGRLYFLFGDTWGRPGDRDAIAWTDASDPEKIVLEFHRAKDDRWLPPRVPGISQGAFEIPSGGISIADSMYVVFTTDHSTDRTMGRSVLAVSGDDGRDFRVLYDLSRDKFINASLWLSEDWLYVYGSGEYRRSSVCLARVRPNDLADRSKLEYFGGLADGQPQWSRREADAVSLFTHDVVGEFSVAYLEPVGRFVMLYNSDEPRGITMRSSETPWGPWSGGVVVFEPWQDSGYGRFIHISSSFPHGRDDLSDPGRGAEWGGEYGPYIMGRFTTEVDGICRVYYTMSTWNPYQVVVMRSDLRPAPGGG
jgi:hypothetical protein